MQNIIKFDAFGKEYDAFLDMQKLISLEKSIGMPLQLAVFSQAVNLEFVYQGLYFAINDQTSKEEYNKLWDDYFNAKSGGQKKFLRLVKILKEIIEATGLFTPEEESEDGSRSTEEKKLKT